MSIPFFLALGAFALLLLRFLFTSIQYYRYSKAHGCQEPPAMPQLERILGYDRFKHQVAMAKAKQILPDIHRRFEDMGVDTFTVVSVGKKFWVTRDPENIKAILATNFKDFGIGQRFQSMGALLGQGIFTSDGGLWEHSRVSTFGIQRIRRCSLSIGPGSS
jgi:hypothetical protein